MSRLFCFGLGYCAQALGARLLAKGWSVAGTARDTEGVAALRARGFEACLFSGEEPGVEVPKLLEGATHLLISVRPAADGDPVLRHHDDDLARAAPFAWAAYLSTVGIYGGQEGEWVNEDTAPRPLTTRAHARVAAEKAWTAWGSRIGAYTPIFRLAGIYGPGRSAIESLRAGTARRIVKPGQVFNRIHVADIASALEASLARPRAGAIYNLADDKPAPPEDVIAYAAELLGMEPPPAIPYDEAELSPMARSFYVSCQRVSNDRMKQELGVRLAYPTYREGLGAIVAGGPDEPE